MYRLRAGRHGGCAPLGDVCASSDKLRDTSTLLPLSRLDFRFSV